MHCRRLNKFHTLAEAKVIAKLALHELLRLFRLVSRKPRVSTDLCLSQRLVAETMLAV